MIGYACGVITGITYGLNPLFGVPLMNAGASVESILLFRYGISVILLGLFMLLRGHSLHFTKKQLLPLLILGVCYTLSSICLFESYKYIASGLATTLIFLYPVLVAIIMVFLKVYPTWQVWLSILVTFIGVLFLTSGDGQHTISIEGVLLALGSALSYSIFIVIVNRNRIIADLSSSLLTFYSLLVGTMIFFVQTLCNDHAITYGIEGYSAWLNLIGLAILPTVISTATLAMSTRKIGATKASVLGVFEPITAILVGALAFHEAITANIVIGIALAIFAVSFMILSSKQPKTR